MDLATLLGDVVEEVKATIVLSNEQQAVLDTFVGKWVHMAIQASAGSGKTFMVEQMVREALTLWPDIRIAYFVFNKSAQTNGKKRLPDGVDVRTFHSLGMRLINRYIRQAKQLPPFAPNSPAQVRESAGVSFILDRLKNKTYGFMPHPDEEKSSWPKVFELAKLVGYGKTYNVKTIQELQKVALKHTISTDDGALNNAMMILADSLRYIRTNRKVYMDFDDMMFQAARIPADQIRSEDKYKIIFVDEAQDASEVRKTLTNMVLDEGGRIVMVGDVKQAIYGFAGSDSANFRSVLNDPNVEVQLLPECRRCSKAVVAAAGAYDDNIRAMDDAPEGYVGEVKDYVSTITTKDAILCRNNAPLIAAYFKLLKAGIPAVIKGVDTLGYLLNLIRESKAQTNAALQKFLDDKLILAKNSANKNTGDKISLTDAIDCILMCMPEATKKMETKGRGGRKISSPKQYVNMWKGILTVMFKPKGDAVELSTIHKSKGDEWESVYWIGSHLMPSPLAKQAWELEEENVHLFYVLYTRAKLNFYKVTH